MTELETALRAAVDACRTDPEARGPLAARIARTPPVDVAEVLSRWDPDAQVAVIRVAAGAAAGGPERAAAILEHLPYDAQARVLAALGRPVAAQVLQEMSPDDVANLLGDLEPEAAEPILTLLPPADQAEIRELMEYPETSAGGLMTPEFVGVGADLTAGEALAELRRLAPDADTAYYVYAVEADGRLAGVLPLRELVSAEPDRPVREIMVTQVVAVPPDLDQEDVARLLERYDLVAVPVVDGAGRILGVVTVDDVLDVVRAEASEDLTRLGGSQPLDEPYLASGIGALVKKRLGWLLAFFVASSVTGSILRAREAVLEQVIALAFFIPLMADTGGNAGSQAATLVVRGLAVGEIRLRDALRVLGRELAAGLVLGALLAGVAFVRALSFGQPPVLATTVALAVAAVVTLASSLGALLPLAAARLRIDPAVVSAPLITTLMDSLGLLIYFAIARALLGI